MIFHGHSNLFFFWIGSSLSDEADAKYRYLSGVSFEIIILLFYIRCIVLRSIFNQSRQERVPPFEISKSIKMSKNVKFIFCDFVKPTQVNIENKVI